MRLTSKEALRSHDLPRDLMQRLDPDRPEAAQSIIEEYLDQSGLQLFGSRTLPEIAERLLAAVADERETPLEMSMAALIDSFTLVRTSARGAVSRLADLLRPHKVEIDASLEGFTRRLDLLGGSVDLEDAFFSTVFGRNLEYYTGFVFEVIAPELGVASPIAGGGRYDRLLAQVGAPVSVPAVGSSIHTERLLAVIDKEGT